MKPLTLVAVLLTFFCNLSAQNLVQNWSFEDTISCNVYSTLYAGTNQCRANHWFAPAGSPDFFNTSQNCAWGGGIPNSIFGSQLPNTGNSMMGFGLYHPTIQSQWGVREYIASMLIDSLISGHKYCVQFYISLSDNSCIAINRVGIYFSVDSISGPGYQPLPYTPQIENPNSVILTDTMNWISISGEYIASGGEKYITIGNFYDDTNTDTLNLNYGSILVGTYYFIDDVYVADCTLSSQNNLNDNFIKIYPNPFSNKLEITNQNNEQSQIFLSDISGRNVLEQKFTFSAILNTEILAKGIYFYQVQCDNHLLKNGLLIKD